MVVSNLGLGGRPGVYSLLSQSMAAIFCLMLSSPRLLKKSSKVSLNSNESRDLPDHLEK